MEQLQQVLQKLSDQHRRALMWFVQYKDTIQPWPQPLSDGTFLATKAKGIYKPEWSEYALSIKQTLDSPYEDKDLIKHTDGSWSFTYDQEGKDPQKRDEFFTNRGLMACWRDTVPVGVLRQVQSKPNVRYSILGLALVTGWEDGHFFLQGFSSDGSVYEPGPKVEIELLKADVALDDFDPTNILDGRRRIVTSLVQRQGQHDFRQALLTAYKRCAISQCSVIETLEAAHILPYRGPHTNHVSNGLLLRADIHTLFDLGLLAIDVQTMTVILAPQLQSTMYDTFAGMRLSLPEDPRTYPNKDALNEHRRWSGL